MCVGNRIVAAIHLQHKCMHDDEHHPRVSLLLLQALGSVAAMIGLRGTLCNGRLLGAARQNWLRVLKAAGRYGSAKRPLEHCRSMLSCCIVARLPRAAQFRLQPVSGQCEWTDWEGSSSNKRSVHRNGVVLLEGCSRPVHGCLVN